MATDSEQRATPQAINQDHEADPKVLELLVCPFTRMPLVYDRAAQELISRTAGLAFPIRHGVPLMTQDAARPLTDADLQKLTSRG